MAQNEIQTLTLYGSPTGGTFTLEFDGQVTSGIAYNASAATVDSALEALSNIGAGDVTCSGGPLPGSAVTIEFTGSLAETAVPTLSIDASGLTGSAITASFAETVKGSSDLSANLTAYWSCEGTGATIADAHGSLDLLRSAAPDAGSATGVNGNCRSFSPGDFGYFISGTSAAPLIASGSDYSVSFWFKMSVLNFGIRTLLYAYPSGFGATSYLIIAINGSKKITCEFRDQYANSTIVNTSALSAATWYHIAFTYDATTYTGTVYLDGSFEASGSMSNAALSHPSGQFMIGVASDSSATFYFDEVARFSKTLSGSEVSILYGSGSPPSYAGLTSGQNEVQTLTVAGSPTQGNLTIGFSGAYESIDYDSTSSECQASAELMHTIGTGNMLCGGGPLPGTAVTFEFQGDLAETDVDDMVVSYWDLLANIAVTQEGSPEITGASSVWSSATITPHITGGTAAWSSTESTASGIPVQCSAAWTCQSLQAPGIINATLPEATWTSGVVSSAVLTGGSAAWSSGTCVIPGVFSGPAIAKWKVVQFAVLPDYPVMAGWMSSSIEPSSHPLNVPTATWSTSNAVPAPAIDGVPTATWSTTEVTLELFGVPVTASWSVTADALSPVLTTASATWSGKDIIPILIGDPGYIGIATFRIIDENLEIITFENQAVSVPKFTSESLSIPQFTGESLSTPALVGEALA